MAARKSTPTSRISVALGREIMAFRARDDLSRDELGAKADVPISTLIRYELGRREIPVGVAAAIAQALGVTLPHLIAEAELHAKG